MPELIAPSRDYQASFLAAMAEFQTEGRHSTLNLGQVAGAFDAFLQTLHDQADPARVPPGKVPQTIWWLVDGAEWIGRVSFRHELNDWLTTFGGHIGYEIRPSQRRRGYGTRALRLALEKVEALGYTRVLVTCDQANRGSQRIIEANGGVLEDIRSIPEHPVPFCRYWIDLPRPPS